MTNIATQRACPVCSSHQAAFIHMMNFELPVTSPLPRSYQLVACDRCGMTYADSSATQQDYDKYYAQFSKYEDTKTANGGGYTERDQQRLRDMTALLAPYLHIDDNIIDIGCANGGMLEALSQHGFQQLTGIDPSPSSIAHIKQRGFNGYAMKISELNSAAIGQYQAIILSHVMEHVFDVSATMQIMRDILSDNGLLYIEVPDAAGYLSHPVVPYYYFDSEHINHFNQSMLEKLAQRHGFSVVNGSPKELPVSDTLNYPAVYVLLRKMLHSSVATTENNNSLANEMRNYVQQSASNRSLIKLAQYADSRTPVIVWGAGSYTQRLLASTRLADCNIVAIVDNDSNKQGLKMANCTIESPAILHQKAGIILVSAALYADTITADIKAMGLPHTIDILGQDP